MKTVQEIGIKTSCRKLALGRHKTHAVKPMWGHCRARSQIYGSYTGCPHRPRTVARTGPLRVLHSIVGWVLTGVVKQVRANVASSLYWICCITPVQNCSVSLGSPFSLNCFSSFQSIKGNFLYCSSIIV